MRKQLTPYRLHFLILIFGTLLSASAYGQQYAIEFYGKTFNYNQDSTFSVSLQEEVSAVAAEKFYHDVLNSNFKPLIFALKEFRDQNQPNDWIYYQLIRKVAEQISPKAQNYFRYTLYKWFLMNKCGYDARIAMGNHQIIFFVRNDEDISDIPFFMSNEQKYMCLNAHDYGLISKQEIAYQPIDLRIPEGKQSFSYKILSMPDFKPDNYVEKNLNFSYQHKDYHFKLKINPEVSKLFTNYPVVDFQSYFNIPLSRETYSSLIPVLKDNLKKMSQQKGVDYLMRFTRYAFLYESDQENFGQEKRLSPELTLMNTYSDCDDRAALFFYLVKEIYNLPMVAVLYPTHLTMAIQFDQPPGGDYLIYKGKVYAFCEPTPQKQNLKIGQLAEKLKNETYKIVYAYEPVRK